MTLLGIHLIDGSECVTKNLKKGTWFPFVEVGDISEDMVNTYQMKNFTDKTSFLYNPNIGKKTALSICCLVGKNGSGKSALLDILYRLINNLSYMLLKNIGYEIEYAYGFKAKLYFSIQNESDNDLYCYLSDNSDDKLYKNEKDISSRLYQEDLTNKEFIGDLFYTIVTNYSNYSFNQRDYLFDKRFSATSSFVNNQKHINGKWLSKLFNKNDGYTTPLVITPYRDTYGIINVRKEDHLAKYRIISALILFHNLNKTDEYNSFVQGYKPDRITFKLNANYKKDNSTLKQIVESIPCLKKHYKTIGNEQIKKVIAFMSTAWENVIREKNLAHETISETKKERVLDYLCYKTLKILSWYEVYSKKLPNTMIEEDFVLNFQRIIQEMISSKPDHITLKIFQTLNYLKTTMYDRARGISIHDIKPYLGIDSIDNYFISLPPPFFYIDIILTKENNEKTSITKMSSGEKQFLYSLSYVLYHISNINNKNNSPKYKHILLIFDEVELYLHPEWQRQYISKLLYVINNCHFNAINSINVLIATHSPFLLSDVPSSNVLALDNGEAYKKNKLAESFCANYYDLLSNQFFLDYSIGEQARIIISKLIGIAKKDRNELTSEEKEYLNTNKRILKYIADPFILKSLKSLGIEND